METGFGELVKEGDYLRALVEEVVRQVLEQRWTKPWLRHGHHHPPAESRRQCFPPVAPCCSSGV